jgi:hypothetical protein
MLDCFLEKIFKLMSGILGGIMPRGRNPRSLENLTHEGRPLEYNEAKKVRRLTVTESGWTSAQDLIKAMGMSVSQFIEELGRGRISVMRVEELESFQDAIDSALLRQAIAAIGEDFVPVEELLTEKGLAMMDLYE